MHIFLSEEEKQKLESQHTRERDGRVRDRIKAILLWSEGWTNIQISQALRIHPETVHNHLEDYRSKQKLKPMNGGSISDLSKMQTEELIQHLEANTYTCVREICAHVHKTYAVEFTVSGMTKWLHRNGFSYKEPRGVPLKADPIKQRAFIKFYESLLNSTRDDGPYCSWTPYIQQWLQKSPTVGFARELINPLQQQLPGRELI